MPKYKDLKSGTKKSQNKLHYWLILRRHAIYVKAAPILSVEVPRISSLVLAHSLTAVSQCYYMSQC